MCALAESQPVKAGVGEFWVYLGRLRRSLAFELDWTADEAGD